MDRLSLLGFQSIVWGVLCESSVSRSDMSQCFWSSSKARIHKGSKCLLCKTSGSEGFSLGPKRPVWAFQGLRQRKTRVAESEVSLQHFRADVANAWKRLEFFPAESATKNSDSKLVQPTRRITTVALMVVTSHYSTRCQKLAVLAITPVARCTLLGMTIIGGHA